MSNSIMPGDAEGVVQKFIDLHRPTAPGAIDQYEEHALRAIEDLELACLRVRRAWGKRSQNAKELMKR